MLLFGESSTLSDIYDEKTSRIKEGIECSLPSFMSVCNLCFHTMATAQAIFVALRSVQAHVQLPGSLSDDESLQSLLVKHREPLNDLSDSLAKIPPSKKQ